MASAAGPQNGQEQRNSEGMVGGSRQMNHCRRRKPLSKTQFRQAVLLSGDNSDTHRGKDVSSQTPVERSRLTEQLNVSPPERPRNLPQVSRHKAFRRYDLRYDTKTRNERTADSYGSNVASIALGTRRMNKQTRVDFRSWSTGVSQDDGSRTTFGSMVEATFGSLA